MRSCSLTDDCDRNSLGAAADRLPLSATVTKVRNWSVSNPRMARLRQGWHYFG
ncbi:hypothetical protein D3C72_2432950 [compost metagenome]